MRRTLLELLQQQNLLSNNESFTAADAHNLKSRTNYHDLYNNYNKHHYHRVFPRIGKYTISCHRKTLRLTISNK